MLFFLNMRMRNIRRITDRVRKEDSNGLLGDSRVVKLGYTPRSSGKSEHTVGLSVDVKSTYLIKDINKNPIIIDDVTRGSYHIYRGIEPDIACISSGSSGSDQIHHGRYDVIDRTGEYYLLDLNTSDFVIVSSVPEIEGSHTHNNEKMYEFETSKDTVLHNASTGQFMTNRSRSEKENVDETNNSNNNFETDEVSVENREFGRNKDISNETIVFCAIFKIINIEMSPQEIKNMIDGYPKILRVLDGVETAEDALKLDDDPDINLTPRHKRLIKKAEKFDTNADNVGFSDIADEISYEDVKDGIDPITVLNTIENKKEKSGANKDVDKEDVLDLKDI